MFENTVITWVAVNSHWSSPSLLPQHILRYGLKLHIGRTLVDGPDLRVSIQLLYGILPGEAIASIEVDRLGGDALRGTGGVELGDRGLLEEGLAGVLQPCGIVDQESGGLEFGPHLG